MKKKSQKESLKYAEKGRMKKKERITQKINSSQLMQLNTNITVYMLFTLDLTFMSCFLCSCYFRVISYILTDRDV